MAELNKMDSLPQIDPELITLVGLVNQYSPTGAEENAVSWLIQRMDDLGFNKSYRDTVGNAIGVIGSGDRQFVLLGHIDTVTGNIPVQIKNNTLIGRGSVDAKGPLAAFVDAIAQIGEIPGWQMVVIGVVDEEGNSLGARSVIPAFKPEFAIVGEPNLWHRIAIGYKGSIQTLLSTHIPKVHSARMEKNSFSLILETWSMIEKWSDQYNLDKNRVFDKIQTYITKWTSGEDGFEEWAEMTIGARLPIGISANDWSQMISQLATEVDVSIIGIPVDSYLSSKNSSLVRAFLSAIRMNNGQPEFVLKTGTADFNFVGPAWNCPIIVYGPGDSRFDHTIDEQIEISDYLQAVRVLKSAVLSIVG